jgi:hypothetical protein
LPAPHKVGFFLKNQPFESSASGLQQLLIRPERMTPPKICHPERSAAESKDLWLFLPLFGFTVLGRINMEPL